MDYIVGQSYDVEVKEVQSLGSDDNLFYVLAANGKRLRVYDFEKKSAKKNKTIKCIYKGLNGVGIKIFHRDKFYLLNELYEEDTVCSFTFSGIREDEKDGSTYFALRDDFGLSHRYDGTLTKNQQIHGAQIDLYVKGIDEKNGSLILLPKESDPHLEKLNEEPIAIVSSNKDITIVEEQETEKEGNDNASSYNIQNFINNGDIKVFTHLKEENKLNAKFNDWVSIYEMILDLNPSDETTKAIRAEIAAVAYKPKPEPKEEKPEIIKVEEPTVKKRQLPDYEIVKTVVPKSNNTAFIRSVLFSEAKQDFDSETQFTIFKKHICALLNSGGGLLFIGCNDDGEVKEIETEMAHWFNDVHAFIKSLHKEIKDSFGPHIDSRITINCYPPKGYCEIGIPSSEFPIAYNGRYWRREHGETCAVPREGQLYFALTLTAI